LEFLERRFARLDDEGFGPPLRVSDLALNLLDLAELLQLLLELRPGDAARFHPMIVG